MLLKKTLHIFEQTLFFLHLILCRPHHSYIKRKTRFGLLNNHLFWLKNSITRSLSMIDFVQPIPFPMPRGWTLSLPRDLKSFCFQQNIPFPIVGKPIRGRGSQGVQVCHSFEELYHHLQSLFKYSPTVMLEEFLSGEEATITIMSPTRNVSKYWAMPIVTRFNHDSDIASYNDVVVVTTNSRTLTSEKAKKDKRYSKASRQCEQVAELMRATAPIRVDIRRYNESRYPVCPFWH